MLKTGTETIDHFLHLFMENDYLRVEFLPEIGAKMIRLLHKKTGRQFLLEPQNQDNNYHHAYYGANFESYDTSGFDECFPTISASTYPFSTKNREIYFPDHGELWSIPWDYKLMNNELLLVCNGNRFPYYFAKHISLKDNEVIIHYHLENLSDQKFFYLWSAHPLLQVKPGDRLYFRDNIEKVFLNWASDAKIGKYGDMIDWPCISINGSQFDYSIVKDQNHGKAIKCFTETVKSGEAAVYFTASDESLIYHFDPKENPYLGIWLCYGGWPTNQENKHLTIALEPASGRPDSLSEAIKRNEYSSIGARSKKEWYLRIQLKSGRPEWAKTNQDLV